MAFAKAGALRELAGTVYSSCLWIGSYKIFSSGTQGASAAAASPTRMKDGRVMGWARRQPRPPGRRCFGVGLQCLFTKAILAPLVTRTLTCPTGPTRWLLQTRITEFARMLRWSVSDEFVRMASLC